MAFLISNIGLLVGTHNETTPLRGTELARLPKIKGAWLIVEGNRIASFGAMNTLKHKPADFQEHYDAGGRMVMPAWCDSHTHLVFAGSREGEFVDKIRGLSYEEIA